MKDESSRPNSVFKMNNKLIWIVKDFEVIAKPDVRIGNPASFDPSNILSQSSDQAPVPTTPSPSFKAVPSNGISAPPAGPSKRPLDSPNNDYTGDRFASIIFSIFNYISPHDENIAQYELYDTTISGGSKLGLAVNYYTGVEVNSGKHYIITITAVKSFIVQAQLNGTRQNKLYCENVVILNVVIPTTEWHIAG